MRERLPIDDLLPAITASLRTNRNLVIEAPPGAGKTTRVPPALLELAQRRIIVLEPRRLAARMAARRVAAELGERVGETAGYQVRFEDVAGPRTRVKFVTEGVLTRTLLGEPHLESADLVILDEFHERHLDGDLALALLRRLQLTARPDIKLIVMSATLNAAPIAEYLEACPILRSEGRLYPVEIEYAGYSAEPLEEQVRNAVERCEAEGDILVFLPGAAEIRRASRSCQDVARRMNLLVLPLHGDLPPEEQDRAVQPAPRRKLILSTNVAESSITIDGVTTVIDSGLARVAMDSPRTGIPVLNVQRISQASARQRAGRAGRTGPGRVIRLYSFDDFFRRPAADTPEIERRELSGVILDLRVLGISDPPWFQPPDPGAVAAAHALLDRLGARQHLAEMSRLPVHPRIARLLVEAKQQGVPGEAARAAALISVGERPSSPDLLAAVERAGAAGEPSRLLEGRLRNLIQTRQRAKDPERALAICVLAAFPDRVARRRSGLDVQLCNGRSAVVPSEQAPEFMVVIDLEERREHGAAQIRLYCPIEPDWLLELFPGRVYERTELSWNRNAERVEALELMLYDDLVIHRHVNARPISAEASAMLAQKALETGIDSFLDRAELDNLLARSAFAAEQGFNSGLSEADARSALTELAQGLNTFAQLREVASRQLIPMLKARVPGLDQLAPERIDLKGRQVKVNYTPGQPPWIASRLQDFFGMREGPKVAKGRVPLLLHLLAPNQRPVQMTMDLAGFWERLYPQVRRELSRRYPRHRWPEDPLHKN